jgi:hypothetical protein
MKESQLCFVGDISLNGMYGEAFSSNYSSYPFTLIKSQWKDCDLVVGNLESPLVPEGRIEPEFEYKAPLRADIRHAAGLRQAGFNALCLSNNHILDYGELGADSTQALLDEQGLLHFGYGGNLDAAKALKTLTVNSLTVGFVGYTDMVIDSPFWAGPTTRGIAKLDIDAARDETAKQKASVDILVVSLHWGIEHFYLPSPEQLRNARTLVDSGADLVIGHHPHVLQGIERYKNGLIAYSLGNFVFSDILWKWQTPEGENKLSLFPVKGRKRYGAILKVKIGSTGISSHEVIGTFINNRGQIQVNSYAAGQVHALSSNLTRIDYQRYFRIELDRFNRSEKLRDMLKRLPRFYKIRPKHLHELFSLISGDKGPPMAE